VREVNLEVDAGSIVDHRSGRAWGLVPGAVIPLRNTRKPYFLLCGRCDGPFNARKGRWEAYAEDEVRRIAEQSVDHEIAELPRLAIREKAASMFRLCMAGLTLSVVLMAMVILITSGHIRIPGL